MASRTTTTKPVKTTPTEKKMNDYIELKLPKLPFAKTSLTPILVILLIIAAYFLGLQTAKVNYLEKQSGNQTLGAADGNTPEASPTPKIIEVQPGNLPVMGDSNAKVTIVEFSDFQCPFCKRFNDEAFQQLKKEYIDTGKVRYAFRHYPLPIHPNAPGASEASECANEQGKFWEYHDVLFERQDAWSNLTDAEARSTFVTYSGELGLAVDQFDSCLASGKYKGNVDKDTEAAKAAGVSATPTAYVNGEEVVGALPFSAFKTIIDEKLNN